MFTTLTHPKDVKFENIHWLSLKISCVISLILRNINALYFSQGNDFTDQVIINKPNVK